MATGRPLTPSDVADWASSRLLLAEDSAGVKRVVAVDTEGQLLAPAALVGQEFSQVETGATDLAVAAVILARPAEFRSIMYRRTRTNPLILRVRLSRAVLGTFLIREVTGFVATSWFFSESIPLKVGDTLTFTTSGAQAGENHAATIRVE